MGTPLASRVPRVLAKKTAATRRLKSPRKGAFILKRSIWNWPSELWIKLRNPMSAARASSSPSPPVRPQGLAEAD